MARPTIRTLALLASLTALLGAAATGCGDDDAADAVKDQVTTQQTDTTGTTQPATPNAPAETTDTTTTEPAKASGAAPARSADTYQPTSRKLQDELGVAY